MAEIPKHIAELLVFIGDGRWWDRPDCLSHPQARQFVPDLDAVIAELRDLYPEDVCKDLVQSGGGSLVIGLFFGDGWIDDVDELLQLGADLNLCIGWRKHKKLVADLRNPDAYEAARFEVGVWAGLRRVGLEPLHEVAKNAAVRRADFVVTEGSRRIAIELKSLADPQRDRNLGLLESRLSLFAPGLLTASVGTVVLEPCPTLDQLLGGTVHDFEREFDATIWPRLVRELEAGVKLGRTDVDGVGTLLAGPREPSWSEHMAGSIDVRGAVDWTPKRVAHRVLERVASARRQLVATEADLRVAVVWGGLDHMPCREVSAEIASLATSGYSVGAVNYIGLLNCHRRGPQPGWTSEAVVLALQEDAPSPDTFVWPRGLVEWSRLHRG